MLDEPGDGVLGCWIRQASKWLASWLLGPSGAILCPFLGEGSPTKVDYRKRLNKF